MKRQSSLRQSSGFTLVELLVVIGIIAVLISMLLPALSKARFSANLVKCASQLRQVALASVMYANDNHSFLPPGHLDTGSPTFTFGTNLAAALTFSYNGGGAKPDPGALIGRLECARYLRFNTSIYETGKGSTPPVEYCPTSVDGRPSFYMYNFHFCQRTVSTPTGNVTVNPAIWSKKITNYLKMPGTPSSAIDPKSFTVVQYQFPPITRPLVIDTIIPVTGASGSVLAGGAHTSSNKRAYNLAYTDGHVTTVYTDTRFGRASNNFGRTIDATNILDLLGGGVSVNMSSWQNTYNFLPVDPPQ